MRTAVGVLVGVLLGSSVAGQGDWSEQQFEAARRAYAELKRAASSVRADSDAARVAGDALAGFEAPLVADRSTLFGAIAMGDSALVGTLVGDGVDANTMDEQGGTALAFALSSKTI